MIVADLDAETLARTRFAISPLSDLVSWLRLAVAGRRHPLYGDPGPAARLALRRPDLAVLTELIPATGLGYVPDLLTPKPPKGRANHVAEQLELVAATPDGLLDRQLTERYGKAPLPRRVAAALDSGRLTAAAAAGLASFWRATLADGWPRLRAGLDADLAARARSMATHGIGVTLASLHRSVRWNGCELRIEKPYQRHSPLIGTELVLSPSALAWPEVRSQLCDPDDAVLGYPAVPAPERLPPDPVNALVGTTRATLLRDLGVARSTTTLSTRHRLAPATVSYHLRILREAGLVTATRDRRLMLYQRTIQADTLLDG
ncbi:ArsR/SmtB family transcription factor [Amycolatopsis samaneae]|uniref:ArsR/SmtB family transcription factor n=1 Tax=Amycolatopsis samaneae TaxID=664691 RepID=A0ABW5GPJ5_9PSEU